MTPTTPHQAIYRRWRAQTFGQIVGQKAVVETLRNGIRSGRSAHAYLFVGPRGTGKTSMARILAKALNCTDLRDGEPCDACPSCIAIREGRALDVSEMDAASNNRVDDMRELLPRIYTTPSDLRRKVFIVDEVQRIREGWDVLLKTLEEPPDHVVFVFCTTDASQIRPAVLSRVQRFDFRKMTVPEISGKLGTILSGDGREAEPEAVDLIARLAAGGMRDAESMLDQLLSTDTGALTAERVREVLGLVEEETVEAFLVALVRGDPVEGHRPARWPGGARSGPARFYGPGDRAATRGPGGFARTWPADRPGFGRASAARCGGQAAVRDRPDSTRSRRIAAAVRACAPGTGSRLGRRRR